MTSDPDRRRPALVPGGSSLRHLASADVGSLATRLVTSRAARLTGWYVLSRLIVSAAIGMAASALGHSFGSLLQPWDAN
jgi:hypothetical protein